MFNANYKTKANRKLTTDHREQDVYQQTVYSIIVWNINIYCYCVSKRNPKKKEYINANCAKRTGRAYVCARCMEKCHSKQKKKLHAFGNSSTFYPIILFFSVFVWAAHRLLQLVKSEQRLQFVNNSEDWKHNKKKPNEKLKRFGHTRLAAQPFSFKHCDKMQVN